MTVSRIEDFALERYFARFEFAVRHQLSASDVEPLTLREVLSFADEETEGQWDQLVLGYTESLGLPALRREIARGYEHLEPAHVLVVAGEEGIFLAMHALLSPEDEVVVVTPAYQSLHAVPRSIGAHVREVTLRPERSWELDPRDVERALTRRTRVIAINFPHNPTGAHIRREVQQRLVDIAESVGAVLLSDEVYRDLEYDESHRLSAAADLSTTAVSLGVMSKSFALAGLRIGWVATRNAALLDRIARLKDYTTICSSAPSELLALIALRARDRVLERSRSIVASNLHVAGEFMASHADELEWVPPRAGSVAFPRFTRRDAGQMSRQLIERESVLLLPGTVFGADAAHFRLGLGRRDFPLALEKLGRLL
ncbi:MAG: aminotransferase class I/II-fold pyridoxal phosphate-dependent enzyme [Gemmatimonadaceae bacterium]